MEGDDLSGETTNQMKSVMCVHGGCKHPYRR